MYNENETYDEKAACDVDIFEFWRDKMYISWIIRFNPKDYKGPIGGKNCFAKNTDGKLLVNDIAKMLEQTDQKHAVKVLVVRLYASATKSIRTVPKETKKETIDGAMMDDAIVDEDAIDDVYVMR